MRAVRDNRVSRRARRVAFVAGMLMVAAVTAAVPAQAQEQALQVGVEGRFCPRPQFATIAEAVAAATENATIQVCPGLYRDTVVIDKPLFLLGAQSGVDARTRRGDPRTESIVSANEGGFVVVAGVTGVTIDGFTVQAPASETPPADGITAGSRTTVVNTVVIGTGRGIVAQQGGAIARNRLRSTADGIVVSGPGSVTVSDNIVGGSARTGILLGADTGGAVVSGNQVTASGTADCRDDSTGGASAGTANTWTDNTGPVSTPDGLCAPA